jgi:hypothetical protein
VDGSRIGVVSEVQGREVEEVEYQQQLGPGEIATDEEEDKANVEEIVHNEVATNSGGCVDMVDIAREQVANVADLQEEKDEPV